MPSNQYDAYQSNKERKILGPVVDKTNSESVMTKFTQESVKASMERLRKHYGKIECSMDDVIQYLEVKKDNSSIITNDEKAILDSILGRIANNKQVQNNPKNLKYINKTKEITKNPYIYSDLTHEKINTLIQFFSSNKSGLEKKELALCFYAACDESQTEEHLTVEQRIELFFLRIHDRKGTCQPHTLGVEGLQGSHPLVPNILTKEDIPEIITHLYLRIIKDYLEGHTLVEQLAIIRNWYEAIDNADPILDKELRDDIIGKIIEKANTMSSLENLFDDNIKEIEKIIDKNLYAIPPFLGFFENCLVAFESAGREEEFWQARGTTFNKHIEELESELDKFVSAKLYELGQFLSEYGLIEEDYRQIVQKGKEKGIIWFKPNSQQKLTSDAYLFVYDEIIKAIANRNSEVKNEAEESNGNTTEIEDANYLRVATPILSLLPPGEEKNSLTLLTSLKFFKNQQEEALKLLAMLGNARQVMYWLLRHYFKARKSGENIRDLEALIIHFHDESGVNLRDCYGMLEKVKEKGSEKITIALLTFEQQPIFRISRFVEPVFFGVFISVFMTAMLLFTLFMTIFPAVFAPPTAVVLLIILGSAIGGIGIASPLMGAISALIVAYLRSFAIYGSLKQSYGSLAAIAVSNVSSLAEAFSPLKNFALSWLDTFSAYKNRQQFMADLTMPLEAGRHILFGVMGIGSALRHAFHEGLKAGIDNLLYSVFNIVQGVFQLATLPLYAIKMLLRTVASVFSLFIADKPLAPKMAKEALGQINKDASKDKSLLIDKKEITAVNHKLFTSVQEIHQQEKLEKSSNTPIEKEKWNNVKCAFFYSNSSSRNEELREKSQDYLAYMSNSF